jgi:hypothetical protein
VKALGKKFWAIPGGHIPLESIGSEPELTSYDKVHLLNVSNEEAKVEITIFYTDKEPVGPYKVTVQARRLRNIRFNDLIDPEAILLDIDFASIITSSVPIIVQFTRQDTGRQKKVVFTTMAHPLDI